MRGFGEDSMFVAMPSYLQCSATFPPCLFRFYHKVTIVNSKRLPNYNFCHKIHLIYPVNIDEDQKVAVTPRSSFEDKRRHRAGQNMYSRQTVRFGTSGMARRQGGPTEVQ